MTEQQEIDHLYLIKLEIRHLWMSNENYHTRAWLKQHPQYVNEINRTLNGPLFELSAAGRKRLAKLDALFIKH